MPVILTTLPHSPPPQCFFLGFYEWWPHGNRSSLTYVGIMKKKIWGKGVKMHNFVSKWKSWHRHVSPQTLMTGCDLKSGCPDSSAQHWLSTTSSHVQAPVTACGMAMVYESDTEFIPGLQYISASSSTTTDQTFPLKTYIQNTGAYCVGHFASTIHMHAKPEFILVSEKETMLKTKLAINIWKAWFSSIICIVKVKLTYWMWGFVSVRISRCEGYRGSSLMLGDVLQVLLLPSVRCIELLGGCDSWGEPTNCSCK